MCRSSRKRNLGWMIQSEKCLRLFLFQICLRQECNLRRPVAKWNRKGVFLFAPNRPLLHVPSLDASGGIISTLGKLKCWFESFGSFDPSGVRLDWAFWPVRPPLRP